MVKENAMFYRNKIQQKSREGKGEREGEGKGGRREEENHYSLITKFIWKEVF